MKRRKRFQSQATYRRDLISPNEFLHLWSYGAIWLVLLAASWGMGSPATIHPTIGFQQSLFDDHHQLQNDNQQNRQQPIERQNSTLKSKYPPTLNQSNSLKKHPTPHINQTGQLIVISANHLTPHNNSKDESQLTPNQSLAEGDLLAIESVQSPAKNNHRLLTMGKEPSIIQPSHPTISSSPPYDPTPQNVTSINRWIQTHHQITTSDPISKTESELGLRSRPAPPLGFLRLSSPNLLSPPRSRGFFSSAGQVLTGPPPGSPPSAWPKLYFLPNRAPVWLPTFSTNPSNNSRQLEVGQQVVQQSNETQSLEFEQLRQLHNHQQQNLSEPIQQIANRSQSLQNPRLLIKQPLFPSLTDGTTEEEELERQIEAEQRRFRNNTKQQLRSNHSTNWLYQTSPWSPKPETSLMESFMATNRSMVRLHCDTSDMLLKVKFRQPFYGLILTNLDIGLPARCRMTGNGSTEYELRVPLNDCGTRQEMPRLFINRVQIQFRQTLDMVDDELKTIICSYPIRPSTPNSSDDDLRKSGRLIEPFREDEVEQVSPRTPARLSYYEPIIIILGLLLISLTLLGLLTGAYLMTSAYQKRTRGKTPSWPGSFTSSRIYQTSPAQVSNMWLAPPLIKKFDDDLRYRKERARGVKKAKAKKYSDLGRTNNRSSDSLVERHSVTTIEIYGNETNAKTLEQSASAVDKVALDGAQKNSKATIELPNIAPIALPSPIIKKEPKSISQADINNNSKQTQRPIHWSVEKQRDTPTRFGSIRATLTTPQQFKRLENIANLFNENPNRMFGSCRKYASRVGEQMNKRDKKCLATLLAEDETFRSSIIESTDKDTFERKLKNNPKYRDKVTIDSWNILEEVLLDPDVNSDPYSSLTTTSTTKSTSSEATPSVEQTEYTAIVVPGNQNWLHKKKNTKTIGELSKASPVETNLDDFPVESRDQDSTQKFLSNKIQEQNRSTIGRKHPVESRPTTISKEVANFRERLKSGYSCHSNEKHVKLSYDKPPIKKTQPPRVTRPLSKQATNRVGNEIVSRQTSKTETSLQDTSVIRVSRFNTSRKTSRANGLTGTLINIDSVTNFTTSEEEFSAFTRSRIDYTSYDTSSVANARADEDSLPGVNGDIEMNIEEIALHENYRDSQEDLHNIGRDDHPNFSRNAIKTPRKTESTRPSRLV